MPIEIENGFSLDLIENEIEAMSGWLFNIHRQAQIKSNVESSIFHGWNGERYFVTVEKLPRGDCYSLSSGEKMTAEEFDKKYPNFLDEDEG